MVRPQPFVTPQHHIHITPSLYLSMSLWPSRGLGYTSIHILCTPLFLSATYRQKLFGLAWPPAPRPPSSARNPQLLEIMPSQHNLVLVLHLNTDTFTSKYPSGLQVPLATLVHIRSASTDRSHFFVPSICPYTFFFSQLHLSAQTISNTIDYSLTHNRIRQAFCTRQHRTIIEEHLNTAV